ncbi:MAG: type IV pilus secretin PilQ [Nitrospirota bacterium]|nr:type IV pilus secretin PilQ [Nitrospirota bacterium]
MTDLGDRVRVEVEGDQPVAYDLSTSVAPASVTVDLPGFTKGVDPIRLDVNKPPVMQVVTRAVTDPRPGVQVLVMLASAMEPEVKVDGTRLFLDFPKGAGTIDAGAAGKESATDQGAANGSDPVGSAVSNPAKTMTRVEVQRGEGEATVVVHGDGNFDYDVRSLNRDRIVVDLAHVASALRLQVLPVDHPILKQIRIGHHSQKVRLVLDLAKRSTYEVVPGDHTLSIRLISSAKPATADRATTNTTDGTVKRSGLRESEQAKANSVEGEDRGGRSPVAAAVPFPERLARIEALPRFAQMAPEAKGALEPEDIGQGRYVGRRISLDFQAADITNVLRLIADVSGFNIVVGEGVKAKVTLKLVNVPWDQALDMLLKMNNLGMIREGNIVWIDTLANIAKQQEEEAKTKESKVKAEDLVTRIIYVQNVPASEIQTTLKQYLSPRGQLNLNAGSNALVIQDTESRIAMFAQLVRELDLEVPQIQIESRIVQADTNYARSLGVQWGFQSLNSLSQNRVSDFRGQSASTDTFGNQTGNFLVNLPAAVGGVAALPAAGFTFGKATGDGALLDLRLSAGEQLGLTKVIAAPKITTLDKREAKIEQGQSIPYQTTSLQGTQTTFVDALLSVTVTPQITSRDPKEIGKQILLKVKATRNAPGSNTTAGPIITKKEALTQVLVRDGETMVIGGIIEDTQSNTVTGLPFLSRLPVIGWLFKNKSEQVQKTELLIFLTPTIVKS